VVGNKRLNDRLAAAIPKFMLAPHWWHFAALAPTSVPQEGHSFGRGASRGPPKIPLNFSRIRSNL
jgi:hypothetical protein